MNLNLKRIAVDKLSPHYEMLSSIICRKSPDDNDKDGLSEVIVLKRTEILTHCLRIYDIDKDGAQKLKCSGL